MKYLNYVPKELQTTRVTKLLIKCFIIFLLILALIYFLTIQSVTKLEEELQLVESRSKTVIDLENKIQQETANIDNLKTQITSMNITVFPFNKFLGTILDKTPSDISITSIFTSSKEALIMAEREEEMRKLEKASKNTEATDENNQIKVPTFKEALDKITNQETAQTNPQENNQPNAQANSPTESTQPTSDDPSTQQPNHSAEQPSRPNIPTNFATNQKAEILILRGSALDLQSISYLAQILEMESYIQKVVISPIGNFNDGYMNYKIFELKIYLGGGN